MGVDSAFAAATVLIDDVGSRLASIETEQDARLQLINRFIVEVLEWPWESVKTEPHGPSGYADYLLSEQKRPSLVIEAKRTGTLLLESASPDVRNLKLGGPTLKPAREGIRQAIEYCLDQGANYAVVTTGLVWVVFVPVPGEGIPFKDGQAFIFPSLESIRQHFALFYELISREGVSRRLFRAHFAKAEGLKAQAYEPLHSVNERRGSKLLAKTPMAADLDLVFREFFAIMAQKPPVFRHKSVHPRRCHLTPIGSSDHDHLRSQRT